MLGCARAPKFQYTDPDQSDELQMAVHTRLWTFKSETSVETHARIIRA